MDIIKPDICWTFYLQMLPLKQVLIGYQDVNVFARVITWALNILTHFTGMNI